MTTIDIYNSKYLNSPDIRIIYSFLRVYNEVIFIMKYPYDNILFIQNRDVKTFLLKEYK